MILHMYAIFDAATKAYTRPFFMLNEAVAARTFGNMVNDPASEISRNPGDYTLYYLGTFDDNTGLQVPSDPQSLGNGLAYETTPGRRAGPDQEETYERRIHREALESEGVIAGPGAEGGQV